MLDELIEDSSESYETILLSLMDKSNISMKTEIHRPVALTQLNAIADWLKAEGMLKEAKIIYNYIEKYLEFMVSYDRKARTEVIAALTEGLKRQMSLTEKLTRAPD